MAPSNKLFLEPSNYAATFQPPAGVDTALSQSESDLVERTQSACQEKGEK